MRISDWSSDVCSSDLVTLRIGAVAGKFDKHVPVVTTFERAAFIRYMPDHQINLFGIEHFERRQVRAKFRLAPIQQLQSLMRALHGNPGKRSEARRVGKECVRTCRSRGAPYH